MKIIIVGASGRIGKDVECAIESARKRSKEDWKKDFIFIDSQWAVDLNKKYEALGRRFRIARNAEVDQFLFGISLAIWPLGEDKC